MTSERAGSLLVSLLLALLVACAPAADVDTAPAPVRVETIEGTDLHRITLTERAAERLGIQTDTADLETLAGETSERLVVPYSAILYTSDGGAWVYTNPETLVFVREQVIVDSIVGDVAVLAAGDPGIRVVSVGVAELYGAETGLGAGAH